TPLIEYTGNTFELAFADYRDTALRKADVHFSSKVYDVDGIRAALSNLPSDRVIKVSGQNCLLEDAIIILNLRCLVGGVVLTLGQGAPIGASEADKAAVVEALVAFAGEFPLEAIAAAHGESAQTADLPPDPQKGHEMRVPGMNVASLNELLPADLKASKSINVKYTRNDLGFLLEVTNNEYGENPPISFFLSDWTSFGRDVSAAHESVGENGKVTGTRMDSWAVTVGEYKCLAAGSSNFAKLDCLVDDIAVLLSQEIYESEGAPDPQKGSLAKLIDYAGTVPFQTIAMAQNK
ncbi:MAG: hypothetical protein AB8B94_00040, partial [Hyphomicrobiales bacterium]